MRSSSERLDSCFLVFNYAAEHLTVCKSASKETEWVKSHKRPLTSHDFGLAVNKLWLPVREVALAGVVEDLEEGAFFWGRAGYPLVKSIFKQQIKLRRILEKTVK